MSEKAAISSQQAIEAAVRKISRGFQELNRVFEKQGGSNDDLRKAYFVLERTMKASRRRAELDVEIANGATDGFSLDQVELTSEPAAETLPVKAVTVNTRPAPAEPEIKTEKEPVDEAADPGLADPRLADPAFARKVKRYERLKQLGGRLVKSPPGPIQPNSPLSHADEEEDEDLSFEPDIEEGVDFIDD